MQLWTHKTHHNPDSGEAPPSPYSILRVSPRHLHSNGFLSSNSQRGVPKLSQLGLPRLCEFITFYSNLRLGWGLKRTCSSPWELSNDVSHFTCTHRGRVESRLLMVGSQIASLTPNPSFCHNLCCRCPNGSCKAIFDIYTLIDFQWYKERLKARCFDPAIELWSFGSFGGLPSPHFGSVGVIFTLFQKWGCNTNGPMCYFLMFSLRLCPINGGNMGFLL